MAASFLFVPTSWGLKKTKLISMARRVLGLLREGKSLKVYCVVAAVRLRESPLVPDAKFSFCLLYTS